MIFFFYFDPPRKKNVINEYIYKNKHLSALYKYFSINGFHLLYKMSNVKCSKFFGSR